ncbi:MAG: methylmalonyl-CoA epimerase [Bacteriovoracaceae bacterium]|nr:methylmalonyl-CoA epimerase [Bacteriovoracaceae bacterium]
MLKYNKDCYLDHVAIAVSNLDHAQKIWEDLGLSFNPVREEVKSQQVTTAFANIDEHAHIELVCPIDNQGPIQKFIDKNGEGIHHMSFKVLDVEKKTEELKLLGYKMIYDKPVEGANNCLVNFVHPKSTGGVLVEIATTKA